MRMIAGFHNTQRTRIRILNAFVIVYAYDLCLSSLLFFFFVSLFLLAIEMHL